MQRVNTYQARHISFKFDESSLKPPPPLKVTDKPATIKPVGEERFIWDHYNEVSHLTRAVAT